MLWLHCLHMSVGHVHTCSAVRRAHWVFWNWSYKPLSLHVGAGAPTLGPLQEHLVLLLLTVSPVCLQCAPGLRHSSPFSLSHQGELVYPKALQAPEELGEPQLLLPPRFLHFLCYLANHESLWRWTPSTGGKAQTWLHQIRNQVHSQPVCLGARLRSGNTLFTTSNSLTVSFPLFLFLWVTLNICFQYNNLRNIISRKSTQSWWEVPFLVNRGEKCHFWSTLVRSATSGLWTGPLPVFLS